MSSNDPDEARILAVLNKDGIEELRRLIKSGRLSPGELKLAMEYTEQDGKDTKDKKQTDLHDVALSDSDSANDIAGKAKNIAVLALVIATGALGVALFVLLSNT